MYLQLKLDEYLLYTDVHTSVYVRIVTVEDLMI